MSREELLIHDQGISVNRKHINNLLTEIYSTFSGENHFFMKSFLNLPKISTNLFIYLSIYLFIYLSIYLSIYQFFV